MDKDEIEAGRESIKILDFLHDMVEQERMTTAESQAVQQEAMAVGRAAGHFDAGGKFKGKVSDADTAVARHENHVQRKKIIELHPELKDELERHINHRPYHPVPPVPPSFARPGAAVQQFHALGHYIDQKRREGVITHKNAYTMFDPTHRVLEDSGMHCGYLDRASDPAAVAHAYQLMKKSLLELHPELADDVRNLGSSRSR